MTPHPTPSPTPLGTCHGRYCGQNERPHRPTDRCYDWTPEPSPTPHHKFKLIKWGLDECEVCGKGWWERIHKVADPTPSPTPLGRTMSDKATYRTCSQLEDDGEQFDVCQRDSCVYGGECQRRQDPNDPFNQPHSPHAACDARIAQLERERDAAVEAANEYMQNAIAAERQNEELRSVLQKIADFGSFKEHNGSGGDYQLCHWCDAYWGTEYIGGRTPHEVKKPHGPDCLWLEIEALTRGKEPSEDSE